MSRRWLVTLVFGAAIALSGQSSFAADPSLHQVYQAADAGNYREAQGMMDQVLRDHPNSAKAHYVEAELLAKQGKVASAKTELDTAERLEPGLPFSKPAAVEELKTRLAATPIGAAGLVTERAPQPVSSFPLGLVVAGLMLIAAMVFFFRRRQPAVTVMPAQGNALGGYGPTPQPYGYGGIGPMGSTAGGMGSGILGSLATGAALGAGMVAGESLVHRMMDGGQHSNENFIPADHSGFDDQPQYDMGGNDFGVADNSGWDDSSSGGGDDWS